MARKCKIIQPDPLASLREVEKNIYKLANDIASEAFLWMTRMQYFNINVFYVPSSYGKPYFVFLSYPEIEHPCGAQRLLTLTGNFTKEQMKNKLVEAMRRIPILPIE